MPAANETTAVGLCGGCGYPILGAELCAFCAADIDEIDLSPDQPAA